MIQEHLKKITNSKLASSYESVNILIIDTNLEFFSGISLLDIHLRFAKMLLNDQLAEGINHVDEHFFLNFLATMKNVTSESTLSINSLLLCIVFHRCNEMLYRP